MANDETIAALERALWAVNQMAVLLPYMTALAQSHKDISVEAIQADAALIRAHIETLRNGGERAQIVAWLRRGVPGVDDEDTAYLVSLITSGAHLPGKGE